MKKKAVAANIPIEITQNEIPTKSSCINIVASAAIAIPEKPIKIPTDLIKLIVASKSKLTPERPVHLFGCGHPILFPISVALGVDLFDSAAYSLFCKDARLVTPTGTVKLSELKEWPDMSPALWGDTPEGVRGMGKEERTEILARHNLQVTYSELARCREAIRNGTIWNLVEERSHCNAELRAATVWLYSNMPRNLIENSPPCRQGGVNLYSQIDNCLLYTSPSPRDRG